MGWNPPRSPINLDKQVETYSSIYKLYLAPGIQQQPGDFMRPTLTNEDVSRHAIE